MRHDLPTPDDIFEELADKTAEQIELRAPIAFDRAFQEMLSYHRFLLALNSSRGSDGEPVNFAEVVGDGWHAPHQEWIRQYRRLFERAAERLSEDDHFVQSLARAPIRLLSGVGDLELSRSIVGSILDLGPMMMHRLEAWHTRRTTVTILEGQTAQPRLALAGSDATAYANVLPGIVGSWEHLLQSAPSMYGWRERDERTDVERWSSFRTSWPFLWQHLSNTAYCLAVTVWNEDDVGAEMFREALLRWPEVLQHQFDVSAELRHRRLLFPDLMKLDWSEASKRAEKLNYDYMPALTPDQLFSSMILAAHDDVVLLTAALLLFWTINEKQTSDIGGRVAKSLLRKERSENRLGSPGGRGRGLRSLFLDLLRFRLAGGGVRDGSYAAELDRLVVLLDNMTERRVVPGRIFTPSTLNGRDELLLAFVAMLVAVMPSDGDDDLKKRISGLASEEEVLPEGDRSLRDVMSELSRFRSALDQSQPQIARGVAILRSDQEDTSVLAARLGEIIGSAERVIEAERTKRLKASPVDKIKIERIRSSIEAALLSDPVKILFFDDVRVRRAALGEAAAEERVVTFNAVAKAQFVEPPMESPPSRFEEYFVDASRESVVSYVWNAFRKRPRKKVAIAASIEDEAFWQDLAALIKQVGPDPVLVVSRAVEGRALRRFLYAKPADRPNLSIERRPHRDGGSYVATVQGVDVHGADFRPGVAWLFSAKALRAVYYSEIDTAARFVNITFDTGEELEGDLKVHLRQYLEWSATPAFEIKMLDPVQRAE
jgi:hypothetical protein